MHENRHQVYDVLLVGDGLPDELVEVAADSAEEAAAIAVERFGDGYEANRVEPAGFDTHRPGVIAARQA